MIERVAVQQGFQDGHGLRRAAVARGRCQSLARHVGGDDVDGQPPAENPVKRGNLPGKLWRPGFTNADRHQQPDAFHQRCNGGGKNRGIDAQRISGGQQDIVEATAVSGHHDIAAMLPARFEHRVGHAEKLIVIITQRGKPADFNGHGNLSPRAATSTSYQRARVQVTLNASPASRMRAGVWVPTIGIGRDGWAMIQL